MHIPFGVHILPARGRAWPGRPLPALCLRMVGCSLRSCLTLLLCLLCGLSSLRGLGSCSSCTLLLLLLCMVLLWVAAAPAAHDFSMGTLERVSRLSMLCIAESSRHPSSIGVTLEGLCCMLPPLLSHVLTCCHLLAVTQWALASLPLLGVTEDSLHLVQQLLCGWLPLRSEGRGLPGLLALLLLLRLVRFPILPPGGRSCRWSSKQGSGSECLVRLRLRGRRRLRWRLRWRLSRRLRRWLDRHLGHRLGHSLSALRCLQARLQGRLGWRRWMWWRRHQRCW